MFKIFKPFESVNKNSDVLITTWSIAGTNKMESVIKNIQPAKRVRLLVGFNKQTHDLKVLHETLMYYKRLGWIVKALPGFHAKIWLINNEAHVGSCNWCPNSIHNYMHKTKITPRIKNFVNLHWKNGYNINATTKLHLLAQKF